jgi:hypothetical protein
MQNNLPSYDTHKNTWVRVWYVVTNILDGYTVPVFRISAKMLVAIHIQRLQCHNTEMRLEEIKFKRTCDLCRSPGETKEVKWDRHLTGMQ